MTTKTVHFDVGGKIYKVAEDTLMKYENTVLAKMVSKNWNKGNNLEPLYIDRNGERFQYILDWYRDGRITVPRTVAIEAVKGDASFFGLPDDVVIEDTHSIDDYVSALKGVKFNLEEMTRKNTADGLALSIEGFAIWAVFEMVNKLSIPLAMPESAIVQLSGFEKIHSEFWIHQSHKHIILAAIQRVFTTLGDEQIPAFLTSVDLKYNDPNEFIFRGPNRFVEFKFTMDMNQSSASGGKRKCPY
jgi:hypothetical protein